MKAIEQLSILLIAAMILIGIVAVVHWVASCGPGLADHVENWSAVPAEF